MIVRKDGRVHGISALAHKIDMRQSQLTGFGQVKADYGPTFNKASTMRSSILTPNSSLDINVGFKTPTQIAIVKPYEANLARGLMKKKRGI